MPVMQAKAKAAESIEEDLDRLELGIRKLKIEYDRFFVGGLKAEPVQLRFSVQRIVKRYAEARLRKYAHRFRFNALSSRFNLFCELWDKKLRRAEQGYSRRKVPHARPAEECLASCRFRGNGRPTKALKELYASFVEARRNSGNERKISFDRFVQGISVQAKRLQEQSGCAEIELRVVVNDRNVQVRAHPGR